MVEQSSLLRRFALNDHTIKNSIEFANVIMQQNSSLFMGSLDIGSVFTNILSDKAKNICMG